MSTAYLDNIKGARGSYDSSINGYEFTVTATLKGVDPAGEEPIEDYFDVRQIFAAINDNAIPLAGDDLGDPANTNIPELEGCWLRKIDADPIGDGDFAITMTYQQSQWGILQIDVGSQLSQIETTKDKDGNNIELKYTYPGDYGGTEPSSEQTRLKETGELKQGGTVTVFRPEGGRIYTVREGIDPALPQRLYEGKVNDEVWWGQPAGWWLCTSITGTSDNAGASVVIPLTFINRYEFQVKLGGWNPDAVYSDDLTGDPVPDAAGPDSLKTVPEYESFDFTDLFPTVIFPS
jgi:hypothetical protein